VHNIQSITVKLLHQTYDVVSRGLWSYWQFDLDLTTQSVPITANVFNFIPTIDEVYLIQHWWCVKTVFKVKLSFKLDLCVHLFQIQWKSECIATHVWWVLQIWVGTGKAWRKKTISPSPHSCKCTLRDKVFQGDAADWLFCLGSHVPSNNKTDITEKLLKVTIKANNSNQIYDHLGCMIAKKKGGVKMRFFLKKNWV
jgi:hypothetical protein